MLFSAPDFLPLNTFPSEWFFQLAPDHRAGLALDPVCGQVLTGFYFFSPYAWPGGACPQLGGLDVSAGGSEGLEVPALTPGPSPGGER